MNIGNKGVAAVSELRKHPSWSALVEAMEDQTTHFMNRAIENANPDACGYARAVRDVYVAFAAATKGVSMNQVKKPGSAQSKE